jgi:exodeoxyribonuclease VII large subunit
VAVQGHLAVEQVIGALQALDAVPEVDVIVLARGGGSVEDLLPFSDEALCRAVVRCRTPVVSAIGHEPDAPLVDLVADVRCSTPTDAGKRVVPDVQEESQKVRRALDRARRVVTHLVQAERAGLTALRSRPVLADPHVLLDRRRDDVVALQQRARRCTSAQLERARDDLEHVRARVVALSPQATLDRGYAVVQDEDGTVVRDADAVEPGTDLQVRLAAGVLFVTAE